MSNSTTDSVENSSHVCAADSDSGPAGVQVLSTCSSILSGKAKHRAAVEEKKKAKQLAKEQKAAEKEMKRAKRLQAEAEEETQFEAKAEAEAKSAVQEENEHAHHHDTKEKERTEATFVDDTKEKESQEMKKELSGLDIDMTKSDDVDSDDDTAEDELEESNDLVAAEERHKLMWLDENGGLIDSEKHSRSAFFHSKSSSRQRDTARRQRKRESEGVNTASNVEEQRKQRKVLKELMKSRKKQQKKLEKQQTQTKGNAELNENGEQNGHARNHFQQEQNLVHNSKEESKEKASNDEKQSSTSSSAPASGSASAFAPSASSKLSNSSSNWSTLIKLFPSGVLERIDDNTLLIRKGFIPDMAIDCKVFINDELLELLLDELVTAKHGNSGEGGFIPSLSQLASATKLGGVVGALAMPDIHAGYGLCIGCVAAIDMSSADAVVAPGGVGYDIGCGISLLRSNLSFNDLTSSQIQSLADCLYKEIPVGVGSESHFPVSSSQLDGILKNGASYVVNELKMGTDDDLKYMEDGGCMKEADDKCVSKRAKIRGLNQCGTLGSGNHYVEVQYVEEICDEKIAKAYGLFVGQIVVSVHCGSRGLGHQIATDSMQTIDRHHGHGKDFDRQLSPVSLKAKEAQIYLKAMNCGINYAAANRQLIRHFIRGGFEKVFGKSADELGLTLLYDVSHNVAKTETHNINGHATPCLVHRKGATRAFGPGCAELPVRYKEFGQPVLIGGSMGTCSYVLAGTTSAMHTSFGTSCHGAGRALSRSASLRTLSSKNVLKDLNEKGITVRAAKAQLLAEEAPQSYKDVQMVVDTCESANISKKVAKLKPLIVIKG